ncbi:hypothetical protein [Dyella sp. 2RAB6]|uniref:hypothetical protein n=1 Tax=Dyella sp. 2RAB6 TaxID=3232992 RepID=UPI003F8EA3D0
MAKRHPTDPLRLMPVAEEPVPVVVCVIKIDGTRHFETWPDWAVAVLFGRDDPIFQMHYLGE